MTEKDAFKSLGMLSRAGKTCSEKFSILMKKEEILSGRTKKVIVKSIFTPDDTKKENNEEEMDIFAEVEKENNVNNNLPIKRKNKNIAERINDFSQKRKKFVPSKNANRKYDNPPCNRYNPKYDCIWKHVPAVKPFSTEPHVAEIIENKTEECPKLKAAEAELIGRKTNYGKGNVQWHKQRKEVKSFSNTVTDPEIGETAYQTDYRNLVTNTNERLSISRSSVKNKGKWVRSQVPDFSKTISREKYASIHEKKVMPVPMTKPNYDFVSPSCVLNRNGYFG